MNWKGEFFGGLTAAIIALPLAIAFGVLSFAPLGAEYTSAGALAGLYGAIFTGIFSALFGGTPGQVTGPTGPMTVVLTGVVAELMKAHPGEPGLVIGLAFLCVAMGGAAQILLGLAGFGRLIKYIPYPVIAGFMNGIAVIIMLGQMRPLLGLGSDDPWTNWQPATLAVGLTTVAAVVLGPRLTRAMPGALMGLLVGTAAFYGARAGLPEVPLGAVIGHIPSAFPVPRTLPLDSLGSSLPLLVSPALTLGLLGAIDSLLTSVVADTVTRTRHDSRQELIGQGIGNLVAGWFGGVAGAGATVRTLVNLNAGGRTRWSGVVHGVALLLVVLALAPVAGGIPMVVLAGILMVTAVGMVDRRSRELLWKLSGTVEQKREIALDLAVVFLVTLVTVLVDLIVAVATGMVVASALFIHKMGRAVLKRTYHGDEMRSRRVRLPEAAEALSRRGREILVFELQGPLFFGSADNLAATILKKVGDARFLLLDLRQVTWIDSTGARILKILQETHTDAGRRVALTYLREGSPLRGLLRDLEVLDAFGELVFQDTDAALEWAEDRLLDEEGIEHASCRMELEEMEIAEGLTPEQLATLRGLMDCQTFQPGELIVREGDRGDAVYILVEGCASIRVTTGEGLQKRLFSYGPGAVFGEMALLEGRPRAADVRAELPTTVYRLEASDFVELTQRHPALAARLLWNIGRELSCRLRLTAAEARCLEAS
ncbi:MAG: SLC26A/SulP transporter family protein [Candidatus Eremiobacterota bacterium]